MFNLSLLSIFVASYISLYIMKMIITWPSLNFLARERLQHKVIQVPENWTINNYVQLVQIFYFIGAAPSLIFLLIPTLKKEGLSFFKPYPKKQLEIFAKTNEWS